MIDEHEEIQKEVCMRMVAIMRRGDIVAYKCLEYCMTPPPCHLNARNPMFVDMSDCKNRKLGEVI